MRLVILDTEGVLSLWPCCSQDAEPIVCSEPLELKETLEGECILMEGVYILDPQLLCMLVECPADSCILVDSQVSLPFLEETILCGEQGRVLGLVRPASEATPIQVGLTIGEAVVVVKLSSAACQVLVPMLGRRGIIEPLNILMRHFVSARYIDTGGLPWYRITRGGGREREDASTGA